MFSGIFVPALKLVYARSEDFRPFQVYIFTSIIKVFVMGKCIHHYLFFPQRIKFA